MKTCIKKRYQQLTLHELRQSLKTRLADYRIPRLLEIVDALPVNVSGKVMKYQLRDQFKDVIGALNA